MQNDFQSWRWTKSLDIGNMFMKYWRKCKTPWRIRHLAFIERNLSTNKLRLYFCISGPYKNRVQVILYASEPPIYTNYIVSSVLSNVQLSNIWITHHLYNTSCLRLYWCCLTNIECTHEIITGVIKLYTYLSEDSSHIILKHNWFKKNYHNP